MWKDEYRIGVRLIDNEHKKLFEMVDELALIVKESEYDLIRKGKCQDAIVFMKAYVVLHFSDEEEYMKSIEYPHLELHRKIHQEFTEEIAEYEADLEKNGYTDEKILKFVHMLEMWLVNHVTNEDQRIVKKGLTL